MGISKGWSMNPARLIGESALDLIPDPDTAEAFKHVINNALKGIPTSRFTVPMVIDGEFQIRHATIRRDIKNTGLVLISFYKIETFEY